MQMPGLHKKRIIAGGLAALYMVLPCGAFATAQITITPDQKPVTIDSEKDAQQEVNEVPGDASLEDNRAWSDERADTIKNITDYIPGVFAQPHNGNESFRLSIRGSGLADIFQGRGLMVMRDGVPINMADGEFEFPVIDPWLIKYAEVFPGANALKYGASTFGGAINFITPTGITDNGYMLRGEGGSFNTAHGQLAAGKEWNGGDIFAAVTGFSQDGYRQQNQQHTLRENVNLGWRAGDDFANHVYVNHTTSDAQIPGALSLAQIGANPRQANPLNLKGDYQRDLDITHIADKSTWRSGDDRFETTVFYAYRALDNPVTTYEFQHNNDTGVLTQYTHKMGLNELLTGFNEYYGNADERRYRNNNATPGAHILDRNLYAFTSEAYAQYQQHLWEKLYGIAGVQASYAMRDIHQGFPYVASQNEGYRGFSPRIGLRYDIAHETEAFANLSRSFEPPSWNELSGGNNPGFAYLRAQRATTAEIGGRGTYGLMHWQAAYYHGWLTNEFVNYRFADGSTATINAARTRKDGIELGMDGDLKRGVWMPGDAVALRAAYTFSHFTLNHDLLYGNNTLPGVPEHYLRAEALYRWPCGFAFGPNVEWSPVTSPVDLANTLYAKGYAIYGLRGFWDSKDGNPGFYVEGDNLLNKSYVATYNVIPNAFGHDGSNFYPGEGRAFYAGLHWKL